MARLVNVRDVDANGRNVPSWVDESEVAGVATVFSTTVELTDTQIKALPTTPILIVPPISGKRIRPMGGELFADLVAAYTNVSTTDGIIFFRGSVTETIYLNGPATVGSIDDYSALFGSYGAGFLKITVPLIVTSRVVNAIVYPSASPYDTSVLDGIEISCSNSGDVTGNFTGGDPANTLTVSVLYTTSDYVA